MANGAIIWEGKSAIDGAPILVIATGIKTASHNVKTGAMIQTWILRADISPVEATKTGADRSICGDCPHRGTVENGRNVGRSCYVAVLQAPRNVWATAGRGRYPRVDLAGARLLFAGRNVRLGAYGDPAAVPFDVWDSVMADAGAGTGYTHQWRNCDARFSRYCMASVDSPLESTVARALGYRTFRVGTLAESATRGAEFLCPASAQAGKKLDCASCLACGGTSSRNSASVFIPVHGLDRHVTAYEGRRDV